MTMTNTKKALENNLKGIDNALVTLKATKSIIVTDLKNIKTLLSNKSTVKKLNGPRVTAKSKSKPVKKSQKTVKVQAKKPAKVKPVKTKPVKTKTAKVQAKKPAKVKPAKVEVKTEKSSLTPAGKPMPVKEAIRRVLGSSVMNPPDIYSKISELGKWSKQSMYNALKDGSKFEKIGSGFKVTGAHSTKTEAGTEKPAKPEKRESKSDKSNGKKPPVKVSDDEADDFIKQVEKMSETKEVL